MKTDDGATVNAQTAHILMDDDSQPTRADLSGGVQFASTHNNQAMHGSSGNGTLLFAVANVRGHAQSGLRHGEFRENVNFEQDTTGLAKDPRGHAQKQMQAQKLNVEFAPAKGGRGVEAREAIAEGSPVVTSRQVPTRGPEQTTRISGDRLVATLGAGNALEQLDGTGNTQIVQSATDGARNTTRGDVLHASFTQEPATVKPVPAKGPGSRAGTKHTEPQMETALETATQDGNVVLTETPAKKPAATTQPETLTGWAQHAEYHASDQVLHLTGGPRISDGVTMQLAADQIDYHRDTQNAGAAGHVKATYTQTAKSGEGQSQKAPPTMGGSGPVHVIADRATLEHAKNQEFFYGTEHNPARMWQDPDSLLAPVIEIDRNEDQLKARGENTGSTPVVNANFTTALGGQQPSVVRVRSQTLVYSDKTRQGDFRGSVTAVQADEAIHADDAVLYLKPSAQSGQNTPKPAESTANPGTAKPASKQSSQLDRIVATGHVLFLQPGRKGNGEKLVYTAADGKYILSGTETSPPQLWDRVHGTTTGEALIFSSQDDKVEVSGGKSSAVTETRAKK
jgi:lipopolysaccharide export system protein LptA